MGVLGLGPKTNSHGELVSQEWRLGAGRQTVWLATVIGSMLATHCLLNDRIVRRSAAVPMT
jgi:hypothetical protein